MKRVLVTGATTPLGRALVEQLQGEPGVEKVVGVEPRHTTEWVDGIELVAFEPDDQELVEFLVEQSIDTIVHAGLAPTRNGAGPVGEPADVIGTMRLCAALAHPKVSVRALVLVSSSEVYPVATLGPLLHRETDPTRVEEMEPAASLIEAEEYARDCALRLHHVNVAILRLAELGGGLPGGVLARLLAGRFPPEPVGFDPVVQWLHGDDAVDAIAFAARTELAGTYNVASAGVLRWSEALEVSGRRAVPVLPIEAGPLAGVLGRAGLPHVPEGAGPLLRTGLAVDAAKLEAAGWKPRYEQRSCVEAVAERR